MEEHPIDEFKRIVAEQMKGRKPKRRRVPLKVRWRACFWAAWWRVRGWLPWAESGDGSTSITVAENSFPTLALMRTPSGDLKFRGMVQHYINGNELYDPCRAFMLELARTTGKRCKITVEWEED